MRQSQSSHFFNNKNNGKEDFEDDFVKATKSPAKQKVRGRQRGRSKYRHTVHNVNAVTSAPVRNNNYQPPTTPSTTQKVPFEQSTRTTFANTPIVVQPFPQSRQNVTQLQASNNYQSRQSSSTIGPILTKTTDETFFDVPKTKQKVQTTKLKSASAPLNVVPISQQTSSTFVPPPAVPKFNFEPFQQQNLFGAIPQRVIIPSQLSPEQRLALQASNGNINAFQSTSSTSIQTPPTTTPVTPQQFSRVNQLSEQKSKTQPQKFNFKTQKYEFVEPQNPTTQFYNTKYETKGSDQSGNGNINLEPTRSGFVKLNNKTYAQRQTTTGQDDNKPTTFNPQQYYQSDQYKDLSPRGFSLAAQQQKKTAAPEIRPQITSRSESRNHKKFSTLVPKENYNPTTFKPNTYSKKPLDTKIEKISNPNKYYSQLITNPPTIGTTTSLPQQFNNYISHTTTTPRHPNYFSTSITPRPLAAGEEDDGLYRPELYEKDFYKNKAKTTKTSVQAQSTPIKNTLYQFYLTSTTTLAPIRSNFQTSDEDEFLKTEHSQNIFASGNQLRAEKEKEKLFGKNYEQFSETSSPRPFSKPTLPPSTIPTTSTTRKPTVTPAKSFKQQSKAEKDVSYDYQYYDTNGDQEYPEIEAIEDFGRTVKKSSTN